MLDAIITSASTNFDTCYDWINLAGYLTDRSQSEIIDIVGQQLWWEIREYKNINEVGSLDTLFMSHLAGYIIENVEIIYRNVTIEVEDDFSEFSLRCSGDYEIVTNQEDFTKFLYVETGQEEMDSLLDQMSDSLDESSDTEGFLGVIARNDPEEIKNYFPVDEKVLSEIDICSRERQLPEVILNAIATALFIKESISMYAEPAGLSPRLEIRVDGVAVILQLDDRELEDTIFIGGLKDEDDDGDVFDKISDYLSV